MKSNKNRLPRYSRDQVPSFPQSRETANAVPQAQLPIDGHPRSPSQAGTFTRRIREGTQRSRRYFRSWFRPHVAIRVHRSRPQNAPTSMGRRQGCTGVRYRSQREAFILHEHALLACYFAKRVDYRWRRERNRWWSGGCAESAKRGDFSPTKLITKFHRAGYV